MSHTILYSRLFVKMSDGRLLPLIKAGDNNVYDVNPRTGREVRSREWEAWNLRRDKALPACTADDIAAYLERLADDAASHAHDAMSPTANFGYYASLAIEGHGTRLYVTLQDGTSGYLKSVYPFTYTDDKDAAMAFSPKILNRIDILRAIPGARSACYDNLKR